MKHSKQQHQQKKKKKKKMNYLVHCEAEVAYIFHLSTYKHFGIVVVFCSIPNRHRKWCLVSIFFYQRQVKRARASEKSIYLPRHFQCGVLNHLCGTQINVERYLSVKSLSGSMFRWAAAAVSSLCHWGKFVHLLHTPSTFEWLQIAMWTVRWSRSS